MEYTTIGDHVNLAARLCGVAEPGQVLLSENTRVAVENQIQSVALPAVSLKGKSRPVPIFQVKGRRNTWEETTGVTKTPIPRP